MGLPRGGWQGPCMHKRHQPACWPPQMPDAPDLVDVLVRADQSSRFSEKRTGAWPGSRSASFLMSGSASHCVAPVTS